MAAAAAKSLQSRLTLQCHRWQPTRFPRPWDFPGKNTGVGWPCLLQCVKVKSKSEVTQSCLTLSNSMDCSLPGSSIHGIFRQEYWSGVPLPSALRVHRSIITSDLQFLFLLESNNPVKNESTSFIFTSLFFTSTYLLFCDKL